MWAIDRTYQRQRHTRLSCRRAAALAQAARESQTERLPRVAPALRPGDDTHRGVKREFYVTAEIRTGHDGTGEGELVARQTTASLRMPIDSSAMMGRLRWRVIWADISGQRRGVGCACPRDASLPISFFLWPFGEHEHLDPESTGRSISPETTAADRSGAF